MKPFILLCLLWTTTYAETTQQKYDQYVNFAKTNVSDIDKAVNEHQPQSLPDFTNEPNAKKYYDNPDQMTADGSAEALNPKNPSSNAIDGYFKNPQYYINPKSPEVQKALLVQNNAYDLTHGISNKYVDCSKVQEDCKETYENKVCTTQHPQTIPCIETRWSSFLKSVA